MQDEHAGRKADRVDHPKRVAAMRFQNLDDARAESVQQLRLSVPSAALRDVERIAHLGLNLRRKGVEILAARADPYDGFRPDVIVHENMVISQ